MPRPRRFLAKGVKGAVDGPLRFVAPALAPIVSRMEQTGAGTNAYLRWNCLPLPVHFYSPVPDLADLERRKVWDRCSDLVGIDSRPEAPVALLGKLGQQFSHECDWPPDPTGDPYQFFTENSSFGYGCAPSTY